MIQLRHVKILYELVQNGDQKNKIVSINAGIQKNNQLEFQEQGINVIFTIFENKLIMNRNTKEYKMEMCFEQKKKHKGTYQVIGISDIIPLEIQTTHFEKLQNQIEVDYILHLQGEKLGFFSLKLEYEVLA